jgi:hypothetical protein
VPRGRSLAITLLMLAVVVAAGIAFLLTQHEKLEKPAARLVEAPQLVAPGCHCAYDRAKATISLRQAATINVRMVTADEAERVVDTLATGLAAPPGKVDFTWDGHTTSGKPAPVGQYKVRVELDEQDRAYTFADIVKVISASRANELLERAQAEHRPEQRPREDGKTPERR